MGVCFVAVFFLDTEQVAHVACFLAMSKPESEIWPPGTGRPPPTPPPPNPPPPPWFVMGLWLRKPRKQSNQKTHSQRMCMGSQPDRRSACALQISSTERSRPRLKRGRSSQNACPKMVAVRWVCLLQGSLKDTFRPFETCGFFNTKIKGHHHLQGNVQVYNVRILVFETPCSVVFCKASNKQQKQTAMVGVC